MAYQNMGQNGGREAFREDQTGLSGHLGGNYNVANIRPPFQYSGPDNRFPTPQGDTPQGDPQAEQRRQMIEARRRQMEAQRRQMMEARRAQMEAQRRQMEAQRAQNPNMLMQAMQKPMQQPMGQPADPYAGYGPKQSNQLTAALDPRQRQDYWNGRG